MEPEELGLDESFANLSVADATAPEPEPSPRRKSTALQKFYSLSPSHQTEPQVAVVLSPASYKHEFGRSWESKIFLKTVVERPERLNACALGIGGAETRVPLQLHECTWGRDLRQSDAAIKVHGIEWVDSLYKLCTQVGKQHSERKVEVPDTWPQGDMFLAQESMDALESVIASIEKALELVFNGPISRVFACVRPPGHHCHRDAASGFCLINNAHIAIEQARIKHGVTHAAIFDFDLHHGDGSQDLCWKNQTIPIGYFSIHDIHSFPTEKGYADPQDVMAASACVEGHDMHVWNVHLERWETLEDFDDLYTRKYSQLFKQAMRFFKKHHSPDSKPLVVISAGFDGSEYEMKSMQRHQVSVPTSFFNRFTRDCVAIANSFCQGRVISLLEGGYSNQALATGVFSHLTGLGQVEWDNEWIKDDIAEQFDKGARKTWKPRSEWPGEAINMGRQLFSLRPPSAKPSLASPKARRKRINLAA